MIVCADDFGLAGDIDEAILDLARRGRLSAVSCMVALPQFPLEGLPALARIEPPLDVGLHLLLTAAPPLEKAGFRSLLGASLLGRIDPAHIAGEVEAQYLLFRKMAGRPPDFVDGHLHVHQFPGVAEGVLRFLRKIDAPGRPYVRNSAMPLAKILKQGVSQSKCFALGRFGAAFRRAAREAGVRTNDGFAGVYNYRGYAAYPRHLGRFVACMEGDGGILMTHPGSREPWRRAEFQTLRETGLLAGRVNRFVG